MAVFFTIALGNLPVSADLYGVALNANETLALYGATLNGVYYNGSSVENVEFSYIGNTFAVRDMYRDAGVIGSGDSLVNNVRSWTRDSFISDSILENTNYLIYRWICDTATLPAPPSGGFRLRFEFPLDIQCAAFQSSILCSDNSDYFNSADFPNYSSTNFYKLFDSEDQELSSHTFALISNQYRGAHNIQFLPVYTRDSQGYDTLYVPSAPLLDVQAQWCNGMGVRGGAIIDDAPTITVSSGTYQLQRVNPQRYPIYRQETTSDPIYLDYTDYAVYILVQCPIIYGDYVLPDPEDDTSLGDINANVESLVLSTDQLRQILLRIEATNNDLLTVERVHTSQFIDIINKLDLIYQAMQQQGGYNPVLTTADRLTHYDYSAQFSQVDGAAPTESDVNNMTPAISGMQSVYTEVVSAGGVAVYFWGLVSIAAAGWFIMRGRG